MVFDREPEIREQQMREREKLPQIGQVTTVNVRDSADKPSNHEVNVLLRDENHERRNVGITTNYNGHIRIPEEGDVVLVGFMDGDGEKPFIQDIVYTNKQRAPLGHAGDWRLRVSDNLYLELSPSDDVARLARKGQGDLASPEARVEIDDSGSSPVINIDTTGDVNINADGDINLAGSGGDPVARKGDSVEVTLSDGSTGSGQITSGSSNVSSN